MTQKSCGSFVLFYGALLCPHRGGEGQNQRHDFQPAQQHRQRKHQLVKAVVGGEIARGADRAQTGADVIEAGNRGGQIRFQIEALHGQNQECGACNHHIQHEIAADALERRAVDIFALEPHGADRVRMYQEFQFLYRGFAQHYRAADLQAAAGGACARADHHQNQQYGFG